LARLGQARCCGGEQVQRLRRHVRHHDPVRSPRLPAEAPGDAVSSVPLTKSKSVKHDRSTEGGTVFRRYWRSRRFLSGISYWSITVGIPFISVITLLFFASGFFNGWWESYSILLGIDPPQGSAQPYLALALSLVGWLMVPAVVGALTGLVVQRQIESYRREKYGDVAERLMRRARSENGDK
jgi:hypothetical protein